MVLRCVQLLQVVFLMWRVASVAPCRTGRPHRSFPRFLFSVMFSNGGSARGVVLFVPRLIGTSLTIAPRDGQAICLLASWPSSQPVSDMIRRAMPQRWQL